MALTPASLSISPITFTAGVPSLSVGSEVLSYLVNMGFKNVQNINVVSNTYTPNNDYIYTSLTVYP